MPEPIAARHGPSQESFCALGTVSIEASGNRDFHSLSSQKHLFSEGLLSVIALLCVLPRGRVPRLTAVLGGHMLKHLCVGLLLAALVNPASAKEKTESWSSDPNALQLPEVSQGQVDPLKAWFNIDKAQLYQSHAMDLIENTMGLCYGYTAKPKVQNVHQCKAQFDSEGQPVMKDGTTVPEIHNFPGPNDYIVIHILKWKKLEADKHIQDVDKQNWYVYHPNDPDWDGVAFATNNRIFGKKKIYLLYVHFGRNSQALYTIRYDVKQTSKIPAYLDHFVALKQLFGIGKATGAGDQIAVNVWGANGFVIDYVPSDVTITPEVDPTTADTSSVQLDPKTFDNEGRYHIDFSVGAAIRQIGDISYVSASNTLVPTKVDKNSLFGLFNYYVKPFDIKSSAFSKYPHVVAGVGMVSKPLQKALIGAGYGPVFANFYAGLLLNTKRLPTTVPCDATPTSTQTTGALVNKTCPEFAFGLNVQVGAIADALKSKK
jgi:hypothetical protein